ncbi:MAG: TraA family conjugative transfer protein [Duodenibacillus sp.]
MLKFCKKACTKVQDHARELCIGLLATAMSSSALAANGAEFEQLYTLVEEWTTGYLGKTIAVSFLLVGVAIGVIRGSIIAVVGALAAAAALALLPAVISAIFPAVGGG